VKRVVVQWTAWLSWLAALSLAAWDSLSSEGKNLDLLVIFLVGVAISAGLSLSRHRLTDTIVAALQTGYDLSEEHARQRVSDQEESASVRMENHQEWIRKYDDEGE
jgi:hypothetical protein